jgi:uncharacterized membrane protein YjfL (UPF0719 family)
MSGDEVLALIVSLIIGVLGWKAWLGGLLFLNLRSRPAATRLLGWLLPFLSGAVMWFVLKHWSSHDVRDDFVYVFFYMAMWFGWLGAWIRLLPYIGLSCRDDMLEAGNAAAGLAIGGGILGVTFIFAGGNIGDGPGWWVVVFCGGVATASVLLLWLIGSRITNLPEIITVDRDVASGWRAAGFFIGSGLILGRAMAGNWHSAGQTLADFSAKGWPVLLLWGLVLFVDIVNRPTPQRPAPDRIVFGVLPCLLFIAFGIGDVMMQGPW